MCDICDNLDELTRSIEIVTEAPELSEAEALQFLKVPAPLRVAILLESSRPLGVAAFQLTS